MTAEILLDCVGMLDEKYIAEAENYSPAKIKIRTKKIKSHAKYFASALAITAAVLIVISLPVSAALNSEPIYKLLYSFSPQLAQSLKPIRKSCNDSGITVEVVSADISGAKATFLIAMQDADKRFDKTADLFDSYSINCPFDSTSHCVFSEYDEETETAYFMVGIERLDGKPIKKDKITFSLKKIILNKQIYSGIMDIDSSKISNAPNTMETVAVCGMGYKDKEPDLTELKYLIPLETLDYSPVKGVTVTGIGYIDNALHIQTCYEDILNTDNHGYIYLIDKDGNKVPSYDVFEEYSVSFRYDRPADCYYEQIIAIPYDELSDYRFYGDFVTSGGCVSGNWEITFSLNNVTP